MDIPDRQDRLTVAVAGRHAATGQISDTKRSQAIAELTHTAVGRADLQAYHAGICLSIANTLGDWQASIKRLEADLCIQAGADREQLAAWEKIRRERAAGTRRISYTGSGG